MERLVICGMSDTGREREQNEDGFLIGGIVENRGPVYMEVPLGSSFLQNDGLLVAVADGMGGHNAGEVASSLALHLLSTQHAGSTKSGISRDETIRWLSSAIISAHHAIVEAGNAREAYRGMGTTIVGLYISASGYYAFNAGDSRLYRFRNGILRQLTKDHTLVQTLVDIGQISWQEASEQDSKNVITNSLGGGSNRCTPEIKSGFSVNQGDILLLCSDGLTDMVDIDTLEQLMAGEVSLQDKVEGLINKANENGGADNITVVLVALK